MRRPLLCALALLVCAPVAAPASGQNDAGPADPAGIIDGFLRTLRGGRIERLGPLLADQVVGGGEERPLNRSQVLLLHRGYTEIMFGPLRSYACATPVANAVTCVLRFQSRSLRQRYTVESALIAGIETLPFSAEAIAK
jgi:hypothetical protein